MEAITNASVSRVLPLHPGIDRFAVVFYVKIMMLEDLQCFFFSFNLLVLVK